MDELASQMDEPVVFQIGDGYYEPTQGEWFRFRPSVEELMAEASLVVAHGGFGTTIEVLQSGTPLVSVPNPDRYDDHQEAILGRFAADGYLRADHGDPMRALAARVMDMNEHLHQAPWAGAWHVKEAFRARIDLAVMIVPETDRPSGYGTRFIAHALEQAGIATVSLQADMVDGRNWDGVAAKAAVADVIRARLEQKER